MNQYSISDLLPYLDCEQKGVGRLQRNAWTPPTDSMRLGTAIHNYCQWLLNDRPGVPPVADEDLWNDLRPLVDAANNTLRPPPFNVLAVEMPITLDIGSNVALVGRLDAYGSVHTNFFSIQWKTVGRGKNIGQELERVRMSPHEISYRHMLRKSGRACDGTLLGVFRTFLNKDQIKEQAPRLELYSLFATADEDREAFSHIQSDLWRLNATRTSPKPRRNWSACFGRWGTCPLLAHCHQGVPLDQIELVPLENRYADLSPGTP